MNNLEQKKNGFTMIEIIVVMVIVGILAAIALPMLFSQIERNRAQGAINTMNYIRTALETCGIENAYLYNTNCVTASKWTPLNIPNPSDAIFTYDYSGIDISANTTGGYTITATRVNGGVNDIVTIAKNNVTGIVTCVGKAGGRYQGFC